MTEQRRDVCPACGETYEVRCKCPLGDMMCKNGHFWHYCPVHQKLVAGQADHSRDITSCQCHIAEDGNWSRSWRD